MYFLFKKDDKSLCCNWECHKICVYIGYICKLELKAVEIWGLYRKWQCEVYEYINQNKENQLENYLAQQYAAVDI